MPSFFVAPQHGSHVLGIFTRVSQRGCRYGQPLPRRVVHVTHSAALPRVTSRVAQVERPHLSAWLMLNAPSESPTGGASNHSAPGSAMRLCLSPCTSATSFPTVHRAPQRSSLYRGAVDGGCGQSSRGRLLPGHLVNCEGVDAQCCRENRHVNCGPSTLTDQASLFGGPSSRSLRCVVCTGEAAFFCASVLLHCFLSSFLYPTLFFGRFCMYSTLPRSSQIYRL